MTAKSIQNEPPGCPWGVPKPIRALRAFCVISASYFGAKREMGEVERKSDVNEYIDAQSYYK